LAAAPQQESNIKFTYRQSNCSRRLIPAPRQCGSCCRLDRFRGHISDKLFMSKAIKDSRKYMTRAIVFFILFYF